MFALRRMLPAVAAAYFAATLSFAQQPSPTAVTPADVQELKTELSATRSELQQTRQELAAIREQLRAVQASLGITAPGTPAPGHQPSAPSDFPTLADVEHQSPSAQDTPPAADPDLVAEKVAEFEQTKVESASKYKVRLSGLVLMNAYSNTGNVDITDLPNRAFRPSPGATGGDVGATLRQSMIGISVSGPTLAGAQTSADANFDFYGGIPAAHYGASMGIARLRTATARLDWRNWSMIAGQDTPFFSPLSPTSYATLAEPALSWSGNLWVWQPQIRVERRWSATDNSNLALSFGVMDTLSEESPDSAFSRRPDPAEASRTPGLGAHFGWNGKARGQNATVGVGGYYGRQNWGFDKNIDSWLITSDFDEPLTRMLSVSGELYRGQAIGGLGGGIWASALFNGDPDVAGTQIRALNDIGGWAQLKVKPITTLEFNVSAGASNPLSSDLKFFAAPRTYASTPLARNQTLLINSILRPRSNLLFALEYRHLRTYQLTGRENSADHVNLSIGVSF